MKAMRLFRCLLASALAGLLICRSGQATTIDPAIWEQLAAGADFVGIAECAQAGGIVAKFKVIESWKGPEPGTEFSLRIPPGRFAPDFPYALCEERYLLTAYRVSEPVKPYAHLLSTLPLWWREIPYEYRLPLFQGRVKLPLDPEREHPLQAIGSTHPDLESLKRAVQQFLQLTPEEQEFQLLKLLANKYIQRAQTELTQVERRLQEPAEEGIRGAQLQEEKEHRQKIALGQELKKASSSAEIVQILRTELARFEGRELFSMFSFAWEILRQGGGVIVLEELKEDPLPTPHESIHPMMVRRIRLRLGLDTLEPVAEGAQRAQAAPSPSELQDWRKHLEAPLRSSEFQTAFASLTQHDPGTVANFLVDWENQGTQWFADLLSYKLASYFAWASGGDRVSNLQKLAKGRDPFVRVAAAVYLCFEDEALGLPLLREYTQLPGDPGVWAALNLARRGDKSAVPRVIEGFAPRPLPIEAAFARGTPEMKYGLGSLRKRALILLSNSAKAGGLPGADFTALNIQNQWTQPAEFYESLRLWWEANGEEMVIEDPWLPLLKEQKID
jgi:hypothetical protein